jgi:transposase
LARRLATIPGLGPIASSAFAATTPDVAAFRSARDYAAWLGLTPRAHSSGGKERLGRISKAGNRYLRRLLYLGAMARISARRGRRATLTDTTPDWLDRMLARKPVKVVAPPISLGPLAFHWRPLAARMARTVWALIARGGSYRAMSS